MLGVAILITVVIAGVVLWAMTKKVTAGEIIEGNNWEEEKKVRVTLKDPFVDGVYWRMRIYHRDPEQASPRMSDKFDVTDPITFTDIPENWFRLRVRIRVRREEDWWEMQSVDKDEENYNLKARIPKYGDYYYNITTGEFEER